VDLPDEDLTFVVEVAVQTLQSQGFAGQEGRAASAAMAASTRGSAQELPPVALGKAGGAGELVSCQPSLLKA
jgi:hypothetical protein